MNTRKSIRGRDQGIAGPIPFPRGEAASRRWSLRSTDSAASFPDTMDDVLAAFDNVSRRITDLARELNCLGHFDDPNSDLPRAA